MLTLTGAEPVSTAQEVRLRGRRLGLTVTLLLRRVALLTRVLLLRGVALLLGRALLVWLLLLAVLGVTFGEQQHAT